MGVSGEATIGDTPNMALTDVSVRTAKARPKAYKLSDGGGLFLLVSPSGGKLWRMKYRHLGKEQLLSIGKYPDLGLKEARKARDAARNQIAEGLGTSGLKDHQHRPSRPRRP